MSSDSATMMLALLIEMLCPTHYRTSNSLASHLRYVILHVDVDRLWPGTAILPVRAHAHIAVIFHPGLS